MMTRVEINGLSSPSCQPKLLIILIFLPTRQLIASEVNTISVKLTATVGARRSDMIGSVNRVTELSGVAICAGVKKDSCALHALYIYT